MKKFLPYILMLVVLVGIFGTTEKVLAQAPTAPTAPGVCYFIEAGVEKKAPSTFEDCNKVLTQHHWLSNEQIAAGAKAEIGNNTTMKAVPSSNDCSLVSGNLIDCIASLFARIAWLIMTIMSWLLWLAGVLLNYVIKETVLTMKEGVDKMTGINIGWKVIRDVMNIGFIFLLVYEGILMIIGQSGKDKIKKFIFSIVLAALLINFSLFFTKVLIDASNVVTIGLYNSMIDSSSKATVPGSDGTSDVTQRPVEGLSAPFMNALSLQKLYGGNSFDNISKAVGGGTNMLIFFLMGAILFLILAFVFFAIAIMFIIRYITLIILLMTSPIAYMGSAIPGMSTYSKQWWESLKGQLLFAPIYMLITMIVLKLIGSEGFIKTEGADWSGLVMGTTTTAVASAGSAASSNSTMSLILNFTVIVGLAIASLVVAKTSATKGSGYIKDATGKLTAFAGGAVMGGAAMLGRNSAGRLGNRFANSEKLKDFGFTTDENGKMVAKSGLVGFAARSALKTSAKASKGTFDARNTSTVGTITGSSALGLNLGKVNAKNNFKDNLEAKAKKDEDFAKMLKPSDAVVAKAKAELAEKEEEMNRPEYKAKEEAAKTEYLDSDDYKNDKINTDAIEAEERIREINATRSAAEQGLKNKNKELEELRKDTLSATYKVDAAKRKEIDDKIKTKQDEIDKTQQEIKDLNEEVVEKNKLVSARQKHVDDWKSEKQKADEKIKTELIKTNNELKGAYTARVNAYADNVVEGNMFWNVVTNGVGYNTSADRMAIANKIRKLASEEDYKTLLAKAEKQRRKENKEKGIKEEGEDEGENKEKEKPEEKPETPTT